jgi:hypothetical protein
MIKVPKRYLPKALSRGDKKTQRKYLSKSRKLYKQGIYYTRPHVKTFKSRPSKHVDAARRIYGVEHIAPTAELANATGCSKAALEKIVKKGEGAYFSSGSRPNQTAQSWGYARLASALTAGKSAAVDFNILRDGCNHKGKAYKYALEAKRKYGYGHRASPKTQL